jgi:hypothetical protein
MLLADRYDDRTHFIFELLQNAEDALARRSGRQGSRSVQFDLTVNALLVSHFGHCFDEADVPWYPAVSPRAPRISPRLGDSLLALAF